MLNKLKKLNKNEVIKYAIILVVTLLLCQNFLQMHYSSDTYVLYDLGYMEYPSQYFLIDGRLISTLVCYSGGILNLPLSVYIVGMDFIGIVFIATAIYLMSKILEKIINPQKSITKLLLVASCFVLILNQFGIEYLLFPESAVMCLGVLLNVLAIKIMVDNKKYKYIKIFYVLLLAVLCYQGLLNMFPVLAIMTHVVKHMVDKRDNKTKGKEFIVEMAKLAFIVMIVVCISILTVEAGKTLLNSNKQKMMNFAELDIQMLKGRISTAVEFLVRLWNESMSMLPRHMNSFVVICTVLLLFLLKTKKEIIMKYFLLVLSTFAICILLMTMFDTGICERVNTPLTMIWGASLIILVTQTANMEESKRTKFVYGFIIISFIINSMFIMRNITEHIASNRVEENMGKTIKYAIEKYEEETGFKVTKFQYTFDKKPEQYAVGIKHMGSLTERKLGCDWSVRQAMNFYCERKFKIVMIPEDIYTEKMADRNYDEFSEDQLIFHKDALYLLIY